MLRHNSHKLVEHLTTNNTFTIQTAHAINNILSDSLRASADLSATHHVQPRDYEQYKADHDDNLQRHKSDLQAASIKEYIHAKTLHDQIARELIIGKQRCREMLGNTRSELKLEMSLERGRLKDSQAALNMKIQGLAAKYEHEAANCESAVQKMRQETMYTIIGYLFTSMAAFLGFLRLLKN